MYFMYICIYISHIYKQSTIQTFLNSIKRIYFKFTANLVIVIADIRHTDPCVEVVLQVIVTVVVPVRVPAHAVPLLLDPGEVLSHFLHILYCWSQTLAMARLDASATLP